MSLAHNIVSSPIGDLLLVSTDGLLTGVYQSDQYNLPKFHDVGPRSVDTAIAQASEQLMQYFAGDRADFDLPLGYGTDKEFRIEVLEAVRSVPFGEQVSFGGIAYRIGKTNSAAVPISNVIKSNRLSIVVPCHRVSSKKESHYVANLNNKTYLQNFETYHRGRLQERAEKSVSKPKESAKRGFLARLLG